MVDFRNDWPNKQWGEGGSEAAGRVVLVSPSTTRGPDTVTSPPPPTVIKYANDRSTALASFTN